MKLLYTLFLLLSGVAAQAADLPFAGTWKGSIGDSKVMVCFSSAFDSQYYYVRHLRGISLMADEKAPAFSLWKETNGRYGDDEKTTGIWTVADAATAGTGNTLDVTWSSPDGKKSMPVKLTKVPAAKASQPDCGAEFYRPIEDALRYTTKDLKFEGREYRSVVTQTGTAFELPATVAGSKNFNNYTRNWLKRAAIESYECIHNSGGNGGSDWDRNLEPVIWTDSKLVVKDWMPEVFCGGPHGNAYLGYESFDLKTGKIIDTWSWIKQGDKSVESKDKNEQKPRLRAMLEKHVDQEECREVSEAFSAGNPYASKDGMVFKTYYFHAMRVCDDDIVIPYKQMMPFLTPAGKAAVAEFLRP